MGITVSSDEIKEYEELKIISQLTPVKVKLKEWDDYIEWKTYVKSLKDLEQRLREINDAKDLRIA